jgi:hypothetical protein
MAVIFGLVLATAALERPSFVPFGLLGMTSLLIVSAPRAIVLRGLVLTIVILSLASTAWVARNAVLIGTPTFRTTFGEILWRGNNPVASGGALTVGGRPILDAAPEVLALVWGRPETEQNAIFTRLAIEYMASSPVRTAQFTAKKLGHFWWFGPTVGARYPVAWARIYAVYYVVLLGLAALGAVALARARRHWEISMIALVFLTVSGIQSIFYVEGRHRWEIEGLLLILAALPVARSIALLSSRFRAASRGRPPGLSDG